MTEKPVEPKKQLSPAERKRMMDEFDKLIETSFLASLNRAARESAQSEPTTKAGRGASLPDSFPDGTQFADVEGVPVTRTPTMVCTAWDYDEPRGFPIDSFLRNGELIDEERFRALVAEVRADLARRAQPKG